MGISVWQLLIILAIVLVLFGAKRLKTLGGDLGGAIKNFRSSMKEGQEESKEEAGAEQAQAEEKRLEDVDGRVIDGEVTKEKKQA